MQRNCEHCGRTFEGQRRTARYCSSSCRGMASKKRQSGEVVTSMPAAAPAAPADGESALESEIRAALADAGVTGWRAAYALQLAAKLATPGESGAAGLSKELDRVMGELLADHQAADGLDELQSNVVPMRQRRA